MKNLKNPTPSWLLALAALFLLQLACASPFLERNLCEMKGGTWHPEMSPSGEEAGWCEIPPAQEPAAGNVEDPAPATATPQAECIASRDAYTWSYVDYQLSSDSGNTACNARFVFTNTSPEVLHLLVYLAWDNATSDYSAWEQYPVEPGATWEQPVNRSSFTTGDVLFIDVVRILVVRDAPGCADLLSDTNQPIWEAQALAIDALACP